MFLALFLSSVFANFGWINGLLISRYNICKDKNQPCHTLGKKITLGFDNLFCLVANVWMIYTLME